MMTLRFIGLGLVLMAPALFAQTGQITGRVTDSTGAVVPGAMVKVTLVTTGADRDIQTNSEGYYNAPLLLPGDYKVSVRQQGFRPITRSGISLAVDQRAEINFTLELGTISENVVVNADAAQLDTVQASQGQVIDNKRIVELPLNGRNYEELALISAGAVQPLPNARMAGFSAGGVRDSQNNFILDGMDNNPTELAAAQRRSEMVQPSIDFIQEFKVQTNAYSAEYGRSMGSRGQRNDEVGTNDLHGTAFEFLRNEDLDAKNFFDPPGPKPPFKRNQFGFSVGGPVYIPKLLNGRNRLFFFTDYEGTKIRQSATTSSNLPTLSMRQRRFQRVAEPTQHRPHRSGKRQPAIRE